MSRPARCPVALTGGAAGPPGSGEAEEEAEKEEEKRPRRPRHAPGAGEENIGGGRGCETGQGGAARAPGGRASPHRPPPPCALPRYGTGSPQNIIFFFFKLK